jgi:uncharacterized protein (DUF885 family)
VSNDPSARDPKVDPNAAINEIAERFWEGFLERNPIEATMLHDDRYDDRLPDVGPVGREANARACRQVLEETDAIDEQQLEAEQLVTRDMLRMVAGNELEALDRRLYQLAIDQIYGIQTLPVMISQYQEADTPGRLEKLLTRFAAFPTLIDQYIGTLREGLADARTSAAVPVRRTIEQIERMLATPLADAPAVSMARVADDAARDRVRDAVGTHVNPALDRLRAFLTYDYEPHARQQPGISPTPDGDAAYRLCIRMQTTLSPSPEEVHRFGLEDLDRIEAQMDEIARRLGHADRHALRAALAADPENHTDNPARLIELASDQTARAVATAPEYFGRLPRAECIVKAVEPYRERESPPAFYMPPAPDGTRPGEYYLNTYQPEERQLHKIASITFHEATPGHHFQIAIEMELEGLPRFRTLGSRLVGTAFSEGWGLYCERLADEMGLYLSDLERFGMLDTQAFRAARLVVDSGLHAFGWTRDQAIEVMHERGTLPPVDAAIEVDRYTIWPGQALTYKIGQRELERLRVELAEEMGDRFDLRAFHDEVLGHGSLPLATLRRQLPGWLDAAIGPRD